MMKSLLFSLSVLALTAFVHTVPCYQNRCRVDNYMDAPSFGHDNANVEGGGGGGYEVGEENGGGGARYEGGGGEEYNEGGGQYQGGSGGEFNGGGGLYQRNSGGGYNGGGGYNPPRRNNYCPNCYVQHFGNGKLNANTINIKHRRN